MAQASVHGIAPGFLGNTTAEKDATKQQLEERVSSLLKVRPPPSSSALLRCVARHCIRALYVSLWGASHHFFRRMHLNAHAFQ